VIKIKRDMAPRLTYRRQVAYNTRSNKIRKVKTPGGHVHALHVRKNARGVHDSLGHKLHGIPTLRPHLYRLLSKTQRTVSRAYGGTLTPCELKERIIRAFLIEEVKIVKRKMNEKKADKEKSGKGKRKSKK